MKVRLLPSNVSDPAHLQPLTTFLIDDVLAVDGGCLGYALGLDEQRLVHRVIVTHTHSDHIATLPIFVAEMFPFLQAPVHIYSTRESIESLKEHIFNDKIWPDFQKIGLPNGKGSGIHYVEIEHLVPFEVENLRVTPVWTNHTVPTIGLAIEDPQAAVVFTADTYHTDELWHLANRLERLQAVFVDVSYPTELEKLAADSKHFTPHSLNLELRKLDKAATVLAVHLKPQHRKRIIEQLLALSRPEVVVGDIGREYIFGDTQHKVTRT